MTCTVFLAIYVLTNDKTIDARLKALDMCTCCKGHSGRYEFSLHLRASETPNCPTLPSIVSASICLYSLILVIMIQLLDLPSLLVYPL